jgi:hypothetical protein
MPKPTDWLSYRHLLDMAAFTSSPVCAQPASLLEVVGSRPQAQAGPSDEAKARKAIPVPLNGAAMAIVQKQIGKHRITCHVRGGYRAIEHHLVQGPETCRDRELPLARPPSYVGQPRSEWNHSMSARAGRVGELRDGAALRHFAADHLAPWAERLARVHDVSANPVTNWDVPAR